MLGEDFVVGPDGTVEFSYWSEQQTHRPFLGAMVDAIRPVRT
jgi:hypothetical protein